MQLITYFSGGIGHAELVRADAYLRNPIFDNITYFEKPESLGATKVSCASRQVSQDSDVSVRA